MLPESLGSHCMLYETYSFYPLLLPRFLMRQHKVVDPSNLKRGSAALLYMLTAAGLVGFNKVALSKYDFPYPNLIVLLQLVFSAVALTLFKAIGLISYRECTVKTLKQVIPLSLTFVLFLIAGMVSLQGVNIAMYTALRRMTLMFVMALDYLLQGKSSTQKVKCSVFIMVLGAFIAAAGDLAFNTSAYAYVIIYDILTALYLVMIARVKEEAHLETFGLMVYNNIVCIPCLLVICGARGELSGLITFEHLYEPGFLVALFFSTILAFVLNYSIFLNISVNSALTQSVCGQLKDAITVFLGVLYIDNNTVYTAFNIIGIIVSFSGSGLYARAKYDESKKRVVLPIDHKE